MIRCSSLVRLAALIAMGIILGGCGDSVPVGTWHALALHDWKISPGIDSSEALKFTPDRDYLVTGIRAVAPPGTHHITLERPGAEHNVLWVSVIGTGEFLFPDGVGLKLRAGESLHIGFHLVNASASTATGTSGIEVIEAEPGSEMVEANILDPSVVNLFLPPGPSSASGKCTITEDQTLFAVGPHMHQLGKHLAAKLVHDGMETSLFDDEFDWTAQVFEPLPQIKAHTGDVINLRCDWYNTTTKNVFGGPDSDQEMCSAFVYRYPAGDSKDCIQ